MASAMTLALLLLAFATLVRSSAAAAGRTARHHRRERQVLRGGEKRRVQELEKPGPFGLSKLSKKAHADKCKVKRTEDGFRERPVRRDPNDPDATLLGHLGPAAKAAKKALDGSPAEKALLGNKTPGPPLRPPEKESRLEPLKDDTGLAFQADVHDTVDEYEYVCDEFGNLLPGKSYAVGVSDVLDTDGHVVEGDVSGTAVGGGEGTSEETGESDTDSDGLTDLDEVMRYGTDELDEDTDGDGLGDGKEVELGTE